MDYGTLSQLVLEILFVSSGLEINGNELCQVQSLKAFIYHYFVIYGVSMNQLHMYVTLTIEQFLTRKDLTR